MMLMGVGRRCQVVTFWGGAVMGRVVGPAGPGEHWSDPGAGPCLIGDFG